MKTTIASLLCFGLVAAAQPIPPLTKGLNMMDCTKVKCPPVSYGGVWNVKFADPSIREKSRCETLLYYVTVKDEYAGGRSRLDYEKEKKDPDSYRVLDVTERCMDKSLWLTGTGTPVNPRAQVQTGAPVKTGVAFSLTYRTLPLFSKEVIGILQYEKVWTLNGKVVAAAVKHPFFRHNPNKQYEQFLSLWYKGIDLTETDKVAMLALALRTSTQ